MSTAPAQPRWIVLPVMLRPFASVAFTPAAASRSPASVTFFAPEATDTAVKLPDELASPAPKPVST